MNVSSEESEAAHKVVHYVIQPINGCDFTYGCMQINKIKVTSTMKETSWTATETSELL